MSPLDLVCSRDGSLSLTKLAACTGHLLLAVTVACLTYLDRKFNLEMWGLYIGVAVTHAAYDKTLAAVVALKSGAAAVPQPDEPAPPAAPAGLLRQE